jgi:hypothetical protein
MTQQEIDQATADLGIVDPTCDPIVSLCTVPLP